MQLVVALRKYLPAAACQAARVGRARIASPSRSMLLDACVVHARTMASASGHRHYAGKLPVAFDDDEIDSITDVPRPKVRPPRMRWMSVPDLVTEVNQALVQGERLDETSSAYHKLVSEASRTRRDNDAIVVQIDNLKAKRAKYLVEERQVIDSLRNGKDDTFELHQATLLDLPQKVQEIDFKISSLRLKHLQNVKDVGAIKSTKSLIKKRSQVTSLIDEVEVALQDDDARALEDGGPLATRLREAVASLRSEFDKVAPKIEGYNEKASLLTSEIMSEEQGLQDVRGTPCREADSLRTQMISDFQRSQLVIMQMARLRNIQQVNAQEIGMLERARRRVFNYASIRALVEAGDPDEIAKKVDELQQDYDMLYKSVEELEREVAVGAEDVRKSTEKLRENKDLFTVTTAKLREGLVAYINQEEQWMYRLGVLRGELMQNVKFIAMLKKAMAK